MALSDKQGLFAKDTLTKDEKIDVEEIAVISKLFDDLHMHELVLDLLAQPPNNETRNFLYYQQGQLIGYLGIDDYGTREKDFVVIVYPDFRRKGIARLLLQAAKEEARHSGIEQLVLRCEHTSTTGAAFAHAIHAQPAYSEHEMELGTFQQRPVYRKHVTIREAYGPHDLAAVVSVMASEMGSVEQAQQYMTEVAKHDNQRFYLMTLTSPEVGSDKPIGSLRLVDASASMGIYGFVVRPEYRGKGYGRQLLQQVLYERRGSVEPIMLAVDVTNTNALGLYLSCGFEIKTTYDYYNIAM